MPVPQGFTITTEACNSYYDNNEEVSEDIKNEIYDGQYVIPEKSTWEKAKDRFRRTPTRKLRKRSGKIYAVIGAALFAVATGLCSYFGVFSSMDYMLSDHIFQMINDGDKQESNVKIKVQWTLKGSSTSGTAEVNV